MEPNLIGLGTIDERFKHDLLDLEVGGKGLWQKGKEGVERILTPLDKKVEFIIYEDKTLVYVKSEMGCPAIYPLQTATFEAPAEAVLMDLDGTSVQSENFWIGIIEQTMSRLLGNPKFSLEEADYLHVMGHSVSEHLQYCIQKYCPQKRVEDAQRYYYEITHFEMAEIMAGRGRTNAFKPSPGFKEFITTIKQHKIKIGLVTSGLYEKAIPEIYAIFRELKLGEPLEWYDAIITAGQALRAGQAGTLGELSAKPHPWLYAEVARVGLQINPARHHRVIGIEDSSAGIIAIRLAGFAAIGMTGGNIVKSGLRPLLYAHCNDLIETLSLILGKD